MELANIRFIDSLNYFPMALSKLPTSFDLPPVFKRGYFPHLFNTLENENYVGVLPAKEYYSPDTMSIEDRKAFLEWFENHKNDEFDMQRHLVEYCISDVEILTRACLKFRAMFLKECNVCPFIEACTIASACNKVFRRNFLKSNTIGIIPKNGYRHLENQSKIAIQWLIWEEVRRGITIQYAAKGKEVVLHGIKVDGYCSETKQIFQFAGCFYHGCTCISTGRDTPLHNNSLETLNSRHESTIMITQRLKSFGYEVIEKWECEFRRECLENTDLRNIIENHPLLAQTPLCARDAFYGGRTGNTVKYYKCKPGEKIKYIDVCSLYPFVCKYGKFPIGHPKVYVGSDCQTLNLNEIEGLIKCKILPPQDLYHPVLPFKMNDKLMFVLCRVCGENMNQNECNHDNEERALLGTWVIDEIRKSLEKGYKILEIYEVWSYKVDQFNPISKVGGLFTEMMDKFIKIKQQASGWPLNCISHEDRNAYISKFHEKEGVQMNPHDITKNAGLRSLAKLMLNSFWGKLGQRENQPKTSIINQPEELYSMLSNPSLTVNHIFPVNDTTLIVNWQLNEDSYEELSTVNVCIAAYVTTQARLKLYSYLEQLGERVLYYDTDSVIFISKENDCDPPTGDFIGDMTDELAEYGSGSYITEFVSGGPKNYSYKVHVTKDNSEKVICKVKGIGLNYAASQLVNFDSIKKYDTR